MRVLDDRGLQVRVQVELTGREVQVIHRALEHVKTQEELLRREEGTLANEFADVIDDHGLNTITDIK